MKLFLAALGFASIATASPAAHSDKGACKPGNDHPTGLKCTYDVTCGARGIATGNNAEISHKSEATFDDCLNYCGHYKDKDVYCVAFNYNLTSSVCTLYTGFDYAKPTPDKEFDTGFFNFGKHSNSCFSS